MGKNEDRQRMRKLLLEGAASPPAVVADTDYFERLRDRIRAAGETPAPDKPMS